MAKIHVHARGGNLGAISAIIKRTVGDMPRGSVSIVLPRKAKPTAELPPCGCHKTADEWEEGKHPRADNGQFGSGGGGAAATATSSSKAAPKQKSATLQRFEQGTLTPAHVIPKALMEQASAAIEQHGLHPAQPRQPSPLTSEQQREASDQLARPMAIARGVKPMYDRGIEEIAREVGGVSMLADIKGGDRLLEKHVLENGGDATKMRDLVRSSIIVNNEADVKEALEAIKSKFEVTRIKDRFASPLSTGYRDMLINVKLPGGIEGEIQVHVPEMIAAKKVGHKLYDVTRKLPDGPEKQRLEQLQSSIYSAALQQN